jgi:aryl-alcohol dehydrogenase-like predicted oxidoreductase
MHWIMGSIILTLRGYTLLGSLKKGLARLLVSAGKRCGLLPRYGPGSKLKRLTTPGGALEAALKAREQGLVRHVSISGHTNPQVQIEALERFPFDSVLCALSVLDHFIFSFAEEFLPVANSKGVAVIGMKVMGLGVLSHLYDRALRYTLSLDKLGNCGYGEHGAAAEQLGSGRIISSAE